MKNSELTKTQKRYFIEICKVLIPEYRKVRVISGTYAYFSKRTAKRRDINKIGLTSFMSIATLFETILPKKLCMFKYANEDFLPEVMKEMVSLRIGKKDVIEYYYNELVGLKFPELKDVTIEETIERPEPLSDNAYELFAEEIIFFKPKGKGLFYNLWHNWYFETMTVVFLVLFSLLLMITR